MLDEPGSGRICLEQTIRDSLSLDVGRQQVIRRHLPRNFGFARRIHR
jgi:hypothetical protein